MSNSDLSSQLSEADCATLRDLALAMIPADEILSMPGADDETIFSDILTSATRVAAATSKALTRLNESAQAVGGVTFRDLNAVDKHRTLSLLRDGADPALAHLIGVVTRCYYRDARVMLQLNLPIRAPFPEGYTVEQGDWSLLKTVKQRSDKIYREV